MRGSSLSETWAVGQNPQEKSTVAGMASASLSIAGLHEDCRRDILQEQPCTITRESAASRAICSKLVCRQVEPVSAKVFRLSKTGKLA